MSEFRQPLAVNNDWELDSRQLAMVALIGAYPGYTVDQIAKHAGRPGGCGLCRTRLAVLVASGYVRAGEAATLDGTGTGYHLTRSGQRLREQLTLTDPIRALIAEVIES